MTLFIYYLRVFFVSFEFLVLLIGLITFQLFEEVLQYSVASMTLNEDAVKWAMAIPASLSGWVFKEGTKVLFPDESTSRILHKWPDYWKLKVHFNVGVLNSVLYLLPCIAIWMLNGLDTLKGLWLFSVFTSANAVNTFSFYQAKIQIRSILIAGDDS